MVREKASVDALTMSDKFCECVNGIPPEVELKYNYVCVQTIKGNMNVRVDEVFIDGYRAEGVYYPFTPFMAVAPEDYNTMVENEKKVLAIIAERENKELGGAN